MKRAFTQLSRLCQAFDAGNYARQVLILGDSTMERISDYDEDRRTLPRMIQDEMSDATVISVSFPAYAAPQYAAYAKAVSAMRNPPPVVLSVVNMRSFSPVWMRQPEWDFANEVAALEEYSRSGSPESFLIVDQKADPQTIRNHGRQSFRIAGCGLGTLDDFLHLITHKEAYDERHRLREVFRVYHGFRMSRAHPTVRSWAALLETVTGWGGTTFLYTAPVNYEAGREYAGPGFRRRVARNIFVAEQAIRRLAAGTSLVFEDMAFDYHRHQFLQPKHPTEHLNEDGRRLLARRLADGLRLILSDSNGNA